MEIEHSFFFLLIPLLLLPLIFLSRQGKKKPKKNTKVKNNIQINNYFPGLIGAIIVGGIFLIIFAFTSGETVFWIIAAPIALIFFLMILKAFVAVTSTSEVEVKRAQKEYRDLERYGSNYMDSVFGMLWKIIKYSVIIGVPIVIVILIFN
jgi:O-antigen/teichoic acid export membrane protein